MRRRSRSQPKRGRPQIWRLELFFEANCESTKFALATRSTRSPGSACVRLRDDQGRSHAQEKKKSLTGRPTPGKLRFGMAAMAG